MEQRPDKATTVLPETVKRLFWEYNPDVLAWEDDRDLITSRVLTEGDWNAITWLRERVGDVALRAWIVEHEGGALSLRQLRFWQLVLDLSPARVDAWAAARRSSVWEERTAL